MALVPGVRGVHGIGARRQRRAWHWCQASEACMALVPGIRGVHGIGARSQIRHHARGMPYVSYALVPGVGLGTRCRTYP